MTLDNVVVEVFEEKLQKLLDERTRNASFVLFSSRESSIKKVCLCRDIDSAGMQKVVLRPERTLRFLLGGLFVYGIGFIATNVFWEKSALPLYFFGLFLAIATFFTVRQLIKKITLDYQGILFSNDYTAWSDVLECYIMTYPYGSVKNQSLYILLKTGNYKEFAIQYFYAKDVSHYVYKFKNGIGTAL